MTDLKKRVSAIAGKYKWKMTDLPNNKYRLDVGIKLKDGSLRFQFVYLWLNEHDGGKTIYMNSRVGPYNKDLLYDILKKAGANCRSSSLAIVPDKYNGQPMESYVIQAVPDTDINDEALNKIVFEVGNIADFLEQMFYGVDKA